MQNVFDEYEFKKVYIYKACWENRFYYFNKFKSFIWVISEKQKNEN